MLALRAALLQYHLGAGQSSQVSIRMCAWCFVELTTQPLFPAELTFVLLLGLACSWCKGRITVARQVSSTQLYSSLTPAVQRENLHWHVQQNTAVNAWHTHSNVTASLPMLRSHFGRREAPALHSPCMLGHACTTSKYCYFADWHFVLVCLHISCSHELPSPLPCRPIFPGARSAAASRFQGR